MDTLPGFSNSGRPRAPGAVGLMQEFLNTFDIESESDQIATPEALAGWMASHQMAVGTHLAKDEHARVLELRERLRDALEARTHGSEATSALHRLDQIAADVPMRVSFADGSRLEPSRPGAASALGSLLAVAYDAFRDEGVHRLKVCRNDGCRWAFYDTSRNRSGVWCTMAICGNRMKGRVYRRRHAAGH